MCLKRNKITKQCLKKTKVNSRVSENASFRLASPENLEEGKISVIYYILTSFGSRNDPALSFTRQKMK